MMEWLEGSQRTASSGTYTKGGAVCSLVPCPASFFCVSLNEMDFKKKSTSNTCLYIHASKHCII